MRVFLLIISIFIIPFCNIYGNNEVSVVSLGIGKNEEEAKNNALRNALEQSYGAFISSKTEILNDQIISDQILSVTNGNIKSYQILNKSEIENNNWSVLLKATISLNNLSQFVQSKGYIIELNGDIFVSNIKQQLLNEKAEFKAICEMVGVLHEMIQTSFNYNIQSGEPKYIDGNNWSVPIIVNVNPNDNFIFFSKYFENTIRSLSLTYFRSTDDEVSMYKRLNKPVYPITINNFTYYLRNNESINALKSLVNNWKKYAWLFSISTNNEIPSKKIIDAYWNWSTKDYNNKLYNPKYKDVNATYWNNFYENNNNDLGNVFSVYKQNEVNIIAKFTWNETKTLEEIEKIKSIRVQPLGIISSYRNGGFFAVDENNNDGFAISVVDIGRSKWADAIKICENLTLSGHDDWVLPSIDDFKLICNSIVNGLSSDSYWSNTTNINNEEAYRYKVNTCSSVSNKIIEMGNVRCVRR